MIRVRTGSRLHFGLMSFPAGSDERGEHSGAPRRFGGVGLMVEAPGVEVVSRPAAGWSAEGPLAERALAFARHFVEKAGSGPSGVPPQHLTVRRCGPEHAGLGTGTQLGLSVGRALAEAGGLSHANAVEVAQRVGRGERSSVGLHGFAWGGVLVDGGRGPASRVAPLVARLEFPEAWRLVLLIDRGERGVHGDREAEAFRRLRRTGIPPAQTDALCRAVLLGMLPALAERDLAGFSACLHEYNARAGEAFALEQGGPYASDGVAEAVALMRRQGVTGVGQSSWGPTVFGVASDEDRGRHLVQGLRRRLGPARFEVLLTAARNRGADVERSE